MAELSQEQLDALIAERVAEARKGLFTEEELGKRVTSEVDRRVETGIQKGLETQKQRWEIELTERAKLSAEELAKKEFEERIQSVNKKEKEIQRKANQLDAMGMLAEAQIPKSQYEKFIGILVTDDGETTTSNVQNFINVFTETKTEIETKVKSEYSNIPKPNVGAGNGVITKADFDKMGYADKVKFKQTNPDMYKTFMS